MGTVECCGVSESISQIVLLTKTRVIFNQLLKAWGAYVASTCSSDAVDLVAGLGADLVVDYSTVNAKEELKTSGG